MGLGRPEVFNTNQGSRFSSREFTQVLQDRGVKISMDGKGRYADNISSRRGETDSYDSAACLGTGDVECMELDGNDIRENSMTFL